MRRWRVGHAVVRDDGDVLQVRCRSMNRLYAAPLVLAHLVGLAVWGAAMSMALLALAGQIPFGNGPDDGKGASFFEYVFLTIWALAWLAGGAMFFTALLWRTIGSERVTVRERSVERSLHILVFRRTTRIGWPRVRRIVAKHRWTKCPLTVYALHLGRRSTSLLAMGKGFDLEMLRGLGGGEPLLEVGALIAERAGVPFMTDVEYLQGLGTGEPGAVE